MAALHPLLRLLAVLCVCLATLQVASAGRDLYKILGIDKNADDRTLKKAYRALAMKYHPDKGGSADKFTEISTAYEVLSDTEKRKVYDQYGEEGVKQQEAGGSPGGGFGHGGGSPFGGGGGQQFQFNFGGGGGGGGARRGRDPFEMFNTMFGEDGKGRQQPRRNLGAQEDRPKENLFAKDSTVTNLKQSKFPGTDAKHIWIIEFYAPWCGHCRQMKPVWERLALELKGFIKVGAVNCEVEKQICQMEGIKSFPIIKVKKSGISTTFEGERELGALKSWAMDQLPVSMVNLRKSESLDKFLLEECVKPKHSKDGACVVYFSDQTETPAWLKVSAYMYKGRVAVAEARARNDALALRLDVGSYPSLVAVCGGDTDHTVTFGGELSHTMTPTAVSDWLGTFEGGKACAAAPRNPKSGVTLDPALDYGKMRVSKLKAIMSAHSIPCLLCMEKGDFVKAIEGALEAKRVAAGGA